MHPQQPIEHAAASRILVVDDDRALTTTLAQIYVAEGFVVDVANDVPEALARARAACPALVILDLQLGEKDGFDFIEEFRTEPGHANVPIVIGSGSGDLLRLRRRLEGAGVVMVMRKPYDIDALLSAAAGLVRLSHRP